MKLSQVKGLAERLLSFTAALANLQFASSYRPMPVPASF
jgi:hypothetical protein